MPADQQRVELAHPELQRVLHMAEVALTAHDLAETSLCGVAPEEPCDVALKWMNENRFDVAPVEEMERARFVDRNCLLQVRTVGDVARPITAGMVATRGLGLSAALGVLRRRNFFFVLEGDQVTGIVTRADLDRPSVAMTMLAFILVAERGLDRIIDTELPHDQWEKCLTPKQCESIQEVHAQRRAKNVDTTKLSCASFVHRKRIVKKSPTIRTSLGMSRDAFDALVEKINYARNGLAHASGLLSVEPDPAKAIDLYDDTRRFAERVWAAVRPVER
jgi:hypothetical protein